MAPRSGAPRATTRNRLGTELAGRWSERISTGATDRAGLGEFRRETEMWSIPPVLPLLARWAVLGGPFLFGVAIVLGRMAPEDHTPIPPQTVAISQGEFAYEEFDLVLIEPEDEPRPEGAPT